MQHMPGPWHVSPFGADECEPKVLTNSGACVALTIHKPDAHLIAAAPDLLEACQLLEEAEHLRQFCEECDGGEGEPEACGTCFPKFDDARIKRRIAIAKAINSSQSE